MPRYIDADKLIDLATHEGAYGYVDVHDILNIPTADVVERKKGKWLRDPPEGGYALYKCSVCGECWLHWWASAMTVEKMTKEVRCCPHCGAEMVSNMRGDKNETN